MKIKHTAFIFFSISAFIITGNAQILINDFSDLGNQGYSPFGNSWSGGTPVIDQYVPDAAGFVSIKPVNSGNPTGDGDYYSVISGTTASPGAALDFTGLGYVALTARIDTGNVANGVNLFLLDSTFTPAASAFFSASAFSLTFSTVTSALVADPAGGNIADIQFYRMTGDGTSDAFRASFDNAVATSVPEPATSGALLLGGAMVFVASRRKHQKV